MFCLAARAVAQCQRPAARSFACLSVQVNYGSLETTKADLQTLFEKVGNVWDVRLIESHNTKRLLGRALVRFYSGEFTPGETPEMPPELPPPTDGEIQAVTETVNNAVSQFNKAVLNGIQIRVTRTAADHLQLHRWYERHQNAQKTNKHAGIFPVNPFIEYPRQVDDYQQGFVTGFKLGLKDGSRNPKK
ncbi:hypothetical protein IWW36_002617 [Coemansia brasiliensis]|uniref:RRM domain-containing protein n=1 Tax=Coemansia brasiliensis TaxID=2650707 RepID=A0A9W8IBM5_9FUNG|nr:hypothetical protein IWW36_002617 [Coemansia brasiliensis]